MCAQTNLPLLAPKGISCLGAEYQIRRQVAPSPPGTEVRALDTVEMEEFGVVRQEQSGRRASEKDGSQRRWKAFQRVDACVGTTLRRAERRRSPLGPLSAVHVVGALVYHDQVFPEADWRAAFVEAKIAERRRVHKR